MTDAIALIVLLAVGSPFACLVIAALVMGRYEDRP